jgi:chromosome segregation ATPase
LQITDDRKRRVIDLYFNQHKTYSEIAEIEHISPRDIHTIIKEEQVRRQKYKDQQQQEELSSKAYKLFFEKKSPVEVAIALNLRESEGTKLYKEYWKLKRLHKLNLVYEEIGDDIRHILELYRRAKKEGHGIEQGVELLQLADEEYAFGLSQLDKRRKWLIDKIHAFDMQIERSKSYLHNLNDEIASANALLNSYHTSCERKRQESESLNNELSRLEALIHRFKSNHEE